MRAFARDLHSYGNPEEVAVSHIELDLEVRFNERVLQGTATLVLQNAPTGGTRLVVDTRDLVVSRVENLAADHEVGDADHELGPVDPVLGAPLTVQLEPGTTRVRIHYSTRPAASGLQWLTPEQTAGKQHPFLFTQSQAIHARSWIPLQDSPGVRVTYSARIRSPSPLRAVMSAANRSDAEGDEQYFQMDQPIPSYLIALAVGDLAFRPLGPRSGVYAEPSVVDLSAREFEDTEAMLQATERLYGPYRWERYDLLVLPPSFPFGGMENPRLTFATPTVLAGDKSLVSLVAHELAHSWSGNLVTNATWRDFWLNEGFTTYIERRIIEEVYGHARAQMEAALGYQVLRDELARLDERDQVLHIDLAGRDPDDGMTHVPYEKGALLLRHLEALVGRPRFDEFVLRYFETFAFQSITTEDFVSFVTERLLRDSAVSTMVSTFDLDEWLHRPGLPSGAPRAVSEAFARVDEDARSWQQGETPAAELRTEAWTTHEWLHFLSNLPDPLTHEQLVELDTSFQLTESVNTEIAHAWLLVAIRHGYRAADERLERYLLTIGRRKLIRPLYEALASTPDGRRRALSIYERARPGYHPICVEALDSVLGYKT